MIELKGKYNTAKVFTKNAEQSAITQIEHLLNQEFINGSKVRVMPDCHAGMGCTVGATMTITDKVVPNLVGVDIGCGMETVLLKDKRIELGQLDKAIHQYIPAGFNIRKEAHHYNSEINLSDLRCGGRVDLRRATLSIGTLGGGNHFIELDKDEDGQLYLVVHSGSRNLGKQVCDYYQELAAKARVETLGLSKAQIDKTIENMKSEGRAGEISDVKNRLKEQRKKVDRVLAYLEGPAFDDYLHDMAIVQKYAVLNRKAMVKELEKRMNFKIADQFTTIHNYIDLKSMILRKGAISAQEGERVLIPMNMRDGSLICVGKGNEDWNCSAPHGAGRIMSRTQAKNSISMSQFEKSMKGIYTSTVNRSTLDEAPFAYKPMDEIISNIGDTVDIVKKITPVYNFKAAE
ncbi:MAG: RtcB family protein [Oscillospiraceae bacterium]|nr:RtcB family protein [Oscillospiraceae bacterium]